MNHDEGVSPVPKLLTAIIDRQQIGRLQDILKEKSVLFHYMWSGMGTASSEILRTFGLSGTEKTVCICIEAEDRIKPLMTAITERMEMIKPGHGIVFSMPVSGMSTTISTVLTKKAENYQERQAANMEEAAKTHKGAIAEIVIAVVNRGFSEDVMSAAKEIGVRGGTIVHARHTDIEDEQKFFGISLQAEKEIVAILIPDSQKKELMQAISKKCGLKTQAHGIVIALPVESYAGLELER